MFIIPLRIKAALIIIILWYNILWNHHSLFVGDQCSWISGVTHTHEFTFPWMFNKVMQQTSQTWNYITMQNFDNPQTSSPTIKNDSTVPGSLDRSPCQIINFSIVYQ